LKNVQNQTTKCFLVGNTKINILINQGNLFEILKHFFKNTRIHQNWRANRYQ